MPHTPHTHRTVRKDVQLLHAKLTVSTHEATCETAQSLPKPQCATPNTAHAGQFVPVRSPATRNLTSR
jgi:hypothetical protein